MSEFYGGNEERLMDENFPNEDDKGVFNANCQTDLLMDELIQLFNKLTLLTTENKMHKTRMEKFDLSEESFRNDDSKTKYLTGLETYNLLSYLHEIVSPFLFTRSNTKLTTFQQLIITLMILRSNLPYKYLSYR